MRYDAVIFDLDGTLLNTLFDIRESVNVALASHGYGARSLEEVRSFVGSGARVLFERALGQVSPEVIDGCAEQFKAHYRENVNVYTCPYEGVLPMLEKLKAAGVKMAVCSNKFDAAVQLLSRAHFSGLVEYSLGEGADMAKKPAPDGCLRLMEAMGVAKERVLYVGDSEVDVQTANNAGICGAYVTWGFRSREDLERAGAKALFDDAQALSDYILA